MELLWASDCIGSARAAACSRPCDHWGWRCCGRQGRLQVGLLCCRHISLAHMRCYHAGSAADCGGCNSLRACTQSQRLLSSLVASCARLAAGHRPTCLKQVAAQDLPVLRHQEGAGLYQGVLFCKRQPPGLSAASPDGALVCSYDRAAYIIEIHACRDASRQRQPSQTRHRRNNWSCL